VPPGLTITTHACAAYTATGELSTAVWDEVLRGLAEVESMMDGRRFGNPESPLLLSVRSGAAVSMPGMLDTVLNLGMNDDVVEGLARATGARFALDSFRRFLDMFADVVLGIPHALFEETLHELKIEVGAKSDADLTEPQLRTLVEKYKLIYEHELGRPFPSDPLEQLRLAICAVFSSWQSPRARKYMEINDITGLVGTAVNIQAMVFGNAGDTSGTGVLFTRNPCSGEKELFGEFLVNAQGEDVVAGIRTPEPISEMANGELALAYDQLLECTHLLETHFGDMQDIEFTVQDNKLFLLQCRSGKRTGAAAVKIACDLAAEGICSPDKAVMLVEPQHLESMMHPQFEKDAQHESVLLAQGLPASPGAACGMVVFSSEQAEALNAQGKPAVLVRVETSPEDVGGMHAAEAVVTARGGMTSHAAVVARGWGKCCVTGCAELVIDEARGVVTTASGEEVSEGDWLSVDGTTGAVMRGRVPLAPPVASTELETFMALVDEHRALKVLANADTPADAKAARTNGAEGIGLVRTEHQWFASEERLLAIRRMVMAPTPEARRAALEEMLPFQRSDFAGIFKAMSGLPVTIRLLDPPLHEFLPDEHDAADVIATLSAECNNLSEHAIHERMDSLSEVNPMLGFRGCRLLIKHPEIAEMQARAIFEGACDAVAAGSEAAPDVMIPLVGSREEFSRVASLVRATAERVFAERGIELPFRVGTMVETPRAALLADELASEADFFSFGTNDLTQMTYGFSRDDAGKFLPDYIDAGILAKDPFETLDQKGVGKLVSLATKQGRAANPTIKIGICGEHGGEPSSVDFFHREGLDYVSCSPFRIPIARLAAAQAAINEQKSK